MWQFFQEQKYEMALTNKQLKELFIISNIYENFQKSINF